MHTSHGLGLLRSRRARGGYALLIAMILMAVSMAFAVFVDEEAVLAFIEQAIDDPRAP